MQQTAATGQAPHPTLPGPPSRWAAQLPRHGRACVPGGQAAPAWLVSSNWKGEEGAQMDLWSRLHSPAAPRLGRISGAARSLRARAGAHPRWPSLHSLPCVQTFQKVCLETPPPRAPAPPALILGRRTAAWTDGPVALPAPHPLHLHVLEPLPSFSGSSPRPSKRSCSHSSRPDEDCPERRAGGPGDERPRVPGPCPTGPHGPQGPSVKLCL